MAFSEWNSSPLVRETTRRGKKKEMFTPTTFSLIHATDFADRMERYILPLVKSGAMVCADRYAYTAFARDVARGVSRRWVRNLYRFAMRPNLAFYFRVPLDVALGRILGGRDAIKYYEAGMDLGLAATWRRASASSRAAFWMNTRPWSRKWDFTSSTPPDPSKSSSARCASIVMRELGESLHNGSAARCPRERSMPPEQPLEFYSEPLPGVDHDELQGKLIVIEGPDAVGRSTQIALLRTWLEQEGHAVLDTGMARSALAGKGIQQAKEGNTLGPITMTLVLRHRFRRPPGERDHSRFARRFRGADRSLHFLHRWRAPSPAAKTGRWIEQVAGFALVPHAVYYLRAEVERPGFARGDGPRRVRLLGKRHGHALRRGHARELRPISDAPDPRAGPNGQALQLQRDRCQPRRRIRFSGSCGGRSESYFETSFIGSSVLQLFS